MWSMIIFQTVPAAGDLWHDSLAQALFQVAIGFLGAGVALWIYRQQRGQRTITTTVISDVPIFVAQKAVASRVQVLFDGKPADTARLMVIEVRNTGKISVKATDYFEPITFEFDEEVLGGEVVGTEPNDLIKPTDLSTFLILGARDVQFPRFALNPREAIHFTVLLTKKSAVRKRGRIDQGAVREGLPEKRNWLRSIIIPAITFVLGINVQGLYDTLLNGNTSMLLSLCMIIIILVLIFTLIAFVVSNKRQ